MKQITSFAFVILLACGQLLFAQLTPIKDTLYVDNVGYTMSEWGITDSITYGDTLFFSTNLLSIRPNDGRSYGFHVHGYGNYSNGSEMPAYSFIPTATASGAAFYSVHLDFRTSEWLLPDGPNPKTYVGYIPIHIDADDAENHVLHFWINVKVKPKI